MKQPYRWPRGGALWRCENNNNRKSKSNNNRKSNNSSNNNINNSSSSNINNNRGTDLRRKIERTKNQFSLFSINQHEYFSSLRATERATCCM
jgi:hypothetical protein